MKIKCSNKINLNNNYTIIKFDVSSDFLNEICFEPGQFITLKSKIEGQSVSRCYSFCSSISELRLNKEFSILVKRVKNGIFSNWLIDTLKIGSYIEVASPPSGQISIIKNNRKNIFFASGSGIAPFLSIINSHTDEEYEFFIPNKEDNKELLSLITEIKNIKVNYYSLEDIELDLDKKNKYNFYICGSDRLVMESKKNLTNLGFTELDIVTEYFHSSSSSNSTSEVLHKNEDSLTISFDGKKFTANANLSILEIAKKNNIKIKSFCEQGICGACTIEVKEGNFTNTSPLYDNDTPTACTCYPQSNMLISLS